MDKAEAKKALSDMQRTCRVIYEDLFEKHGRECPESLQDIYNGSITLDGTIDRLPEPAPAQTTGA